MSAPSHLDLADAPTISVKIDSENCIAGVSREVLNVLSSCARGLPADAAVWDLSLLLVEGQHVRKQTVLSWLNKAYLCTYGEPFADDDQQQSQQQTERRTDQQAPAQQPEEQQGMQQGGEGMAHAAAGEEQQQGGEGLGQEAATDSVAAWQTLQETLSQYDTQHGPTFVVLTELLLFADAVGSSPPLLQACVADLEQLAALRLRVLLPEALVVPGVGRHVDLLADAVYMWGPNSMYQAAPKRPPMVLCPKASFRSMQAAVTEQTQQQTEALLYAAYKLQLSHLAEVLEGFIRQQVCTSSSMLRCQLRPIMSQRVLAAAGVFKQLQESMLLNRWCTSSCSLVPGRDSSRMAVPTPPAGQTFRSSVILQEDYLGMPKGYSGDIEVDLCKGPLAVNKLGHLAQLHVGPVASSAVERKAMLGPAPLYDPATAWRPPAPAAAADEFEDDDDDDV